MSPSQRRPVTESVDSSDRAGDGIDAARQRVEHALLVRIAGRDKVALTELYHIYGKPLFSYAVRVLGNREDAEEAIQDTFVRIWNKAPSYDRNGAKPYACAVLILRGLCLDRLRKRGRKKVVPTVPIDLERGDAEVRSDRSIENLFFRETMRRVHSALESLPTDERRCVELAVFGDASHSNIARETGEPLGTVKSRLRRGLGKLRQRLSRKEQKS